ncbi:hypothetical protein D915_004706 [Fasciola hepatica]|uniref:Secreted protein n=1 Tax=Fasciola hepatica TaxID=6192 RepID=A0A4E0RCY2_FASHE|nr:hypothetical protein D915_004706 [Fasciola hepatica]
MFFLCAVAFSHPSLALSPILSSNYWSRFLVLSRFDSAAEPVTTSIKSDSSFFFRNDQSICWFVFVAWSPNRTVLFGINRPGANPLVIFARSDWT